MIVKTAAPDWAFSVSDLKCAITPRTKAVIVNSPGNPSGKVFARTELDGIADVARRHDLFVFTDEIYEYFLYDGREPVRFATLPGMAERTITVGGYTKTFSITGWRIGYSVAHQRWAHLIGAMNDLLYVCAPTPLQAGVAAGIEQLSDSFYRDLACAYQAKRDRFCHALAKAGLTPSIPQGAYYVLADVSSLPGKTGKERAKYLLDKTGVAGVPGEAFFSGTEGHHFVRFSYAKTNSDLDEVCRRLARVGYDAKPECNAMGTPLYGSFNPYACATASLVVSTTAMTSLQISVRVRRLSLLVLPVMALFVSACSQPAVQRPIPAKPVPSADRTQPGDRRILAGEWEYEDGPVVMMTLDEQGNGPYAWENGRLETHTLTDHTWQGMWFQKENDREGGFSVELSPDFSEGGGMWWYTRIGSDYSPAQKGGTFHIFRKTFPEKASETPPAP